MKTSSISERSCLIAFRDSTISDRLIFNVTRLEKELYLNITLNIIRNRINKNPVPG